MKKIFRFSKKAISVISVMLLFSLFAFPLTSCTQKSNYEEDEAFVKFGVSVKKSDNYETDKQITFNPKEFFDPLRIEKINYKDSAISSLSTITIEQDIVLFNKLQKLFDQELVFEVTDDIKAPTFYSLSFSIIYKNGAHVRLYIEGKSDLCLKTDTAIYRCTDIRDLDFNEIADLMSKERK